jgi:hypothetical protein
MASSINIFLQTKNQNIMKNIYMILAAGAIMTTAACTQEKETQVSSVITVIKTEPKDGTFRKNELVVLSVDASVASGTLSYQWYSQHNAAGSKEDPPMSLAQPVQGETAVTCTVPSTQEDTLYYYVAITRTSPQGERSSYAKNSKQVKIIIGALSNAPKPELTTNLADKAIRKGTTNAMLDVSVKDVSSVVGRTYRWYKSDNDDGSDSTLLKSTQRILDAPDAQDAKRYLTDFYVLDDLLTNVDTFYVFVEVTDSIPNTASVDNPTAVTRSKIAKIRVYSAYISISKSGDINKTVGDNAKITITNSDGNGTIKYSDKYPTNVELSYVWDSLNASGTWCRIDSGNITEHVVPNEVARVQKYRVTAIATGTEDVYITAPVEVTATIAKKKANVKIESIVKNADGSIQVNVSGNNGTLSYEWHKVEADGRDNVIESAAGNSLTAADARGNSVCFYVKVKDSVTITESNRDTHEAGESVKDSSKVCLN